jgi:hypothetical protein
VFPVRYEVNTDILFRRNSLFKGLIMQFDVRHYQKIYMGKVVIRLEDKMVWNTHICMIYKCNLGRVNLGQSQILFFPCISSRPSHQISLQIINFFRERLFSNLLSSSPFYYYYYKSSRLRLISSELHFNWSIYQSVVGRVRWVREITFVFLLKVTNKIYNIKYF